MAMTGGEVRQAVKNLENLKGLMNRQVDAVIAELQKMALDTEADKERAARADKQAAEVPEPSGNPAAKEKTGDA